MTQYNHSIKLYKKVLNDSLLIALSFLQRLNIAAAKLCQFRATNKLTDRIWQMSWADTHPQYIPGVKLNLTVNIISVVVVAVYLYLKDNILE